MRKQLSPPLKRPVLTIYAWYFALHHIRLAPALDFLYMPTFPPPIGDDDDEPLDNR